MRHIVRSICIIATTFLALNLLACCALAQMFNGPQFIGFRNPNYIAAGHMNGDAHLDIVTADDVWSVSVRLADGAGSLLWPVFCMTSGRPTALALGDLNNDGKVDVATASYHDHNVHVLLGDGTGALAVAGTYGAGASPYSIAIGDINQDGWQDISTANFGSNNISVLIGTGGGGFASANTVAVAGASPWAIAAMDLDHNGALDLATTDSATNNISILLGVGFGAFGTPVSLPVGGSGPVDLVVCDLNSDGNEDLLTSNYYSDDVSVLYGTGAAAFASPATHAVGQTPYSLAVGDMDGDSRLDIVTANNGANSVSLLRSTGPATFATKRDFPLDGGPFLVLVTDITQDSKLDIVSLLYITRQISMLVGDGTGNFGVLSTYPAGKEPAWVAAGDLNGDGNVDMVVPGDTSYFAVLLGNGTGGLTLKKLYPVGGSSETPLTAHLRDLNGDGNLDVVVICRPHSYVFLGDGTGAFGAKLWFATSTNFGVEVEPGEMNGDGIIDLVYIPGSNFPTPQSLTILEGNGLGSYASGATYVVDGYATLLGAVDVNGDGTNDFATCNKSFKTITTILGNGAGALSPGVTLSPSPFLASSGRISDLNRDGIPDLLLVNQNFDSVSILLGAGSGMFSSLAHFATGDSPIHSAIGDLTGDSIPEVVTTNSKGNVSVLPGYGYGILGTPSHFGTAVGPMSSLIQDVNQDGRADIVTANFSYGGSITVLFNNHTVSTGLSSYGKGTPGCSGAITMGANIPPKINSFNFGLTCTNAPANSLGLGLIANAHNQMGMDALGLGILLHVDLLSASELLAYNIISDASGMGYAPAAIPNNPAVVGSIYYSQSVWVEDPGFAVCSTAQYGLVSSRGLAITILP